MSNGFDSGKRVMNGTHGELWLDGEWVAEIKAFQAKVAATKEDVPRCGSMMTDKKVTSLAGTGSLTMHKVYSRMGQKLSEALKSGRDVRCTIVGSLNDPDAYGAERVALYNCSFDDLTLADWQAATLGSTTAPFTFSNFEYLDMVGA